MLEALCCYIFCDPHQQSWNHYLYSGEIFRGRNPRNFSTSKILGYAVCFTRLNTSLRVFPDSIFGLPLTLSTIIVITKEISEGSQAPLSILC